MEFISPHHRRQFDGLPLGQQQDLWLVWMESALSRCERRDWRSGALFSGCAFDLAWLAHQRHGNACMPVELTLAAIFSAKTLAEQGKPEPANKVVSLALKRLAASTPAGEATSGEVRKCLDVLAEPSQQSAFFSDYLNWPEV